MSSPIYLTLESDIQGLISTDCNSQVLVDNCYQSAHENSIFVFSLTQAQSSIQDDVKHLGLRFYKFLGKSSPLFCNAINNNERLEMMFNIYRTNRYGRMEKYYLIELRGVMAQAIHQGFRINDVDYEYTPIDYDYILCRHLTAHTEFDYLLTPDNYGRPFPVV